MGQRGAETPLGRAADLLAALEERAGHVPPHALIAELLGERGARARLLARLGPDAADPLDELLTAAMAHESAHPHSLQGFLHWLRRAASEVKRETEGAADQVRVMTVHGAKGLQAPVVILPDTTGTPPREVGLRWTADGLPLWAPRKEGFSTPEYEGAQSDKAEREAEETNRLLYVGADPAPRTGCWSAAGPRPPPETLVPKVKRRLHVLARRRPLRPRLRRAATASPASAAAPQPQKEDRAATRPEMTRRAPARLGAHPRRGAEAPPLTPSRLDEEEAGAGPPRRPHGLRADRRAGASAAAT
jgi:ATP-dependent helicase/nuclease subunit A